MPRRRVRVRRRHARSLRLSALFLLAALIIYLVSLAVGGGAPAQETAAEEGAQTSVAAGPALTQQVSMAPLSVYLVELGAYGDDASARVEAARNARRGAAGYILQENGVYYVMGACYDDKTQAQDVAARLTVSEQISAQVHEKSAGEVLLRVTASQAQVDALAAADAALREAAGQMGQIAFQLDGGELNADQARARLEVLELDAREALEALRAAAGETGGPVIEGLCELLRDLLENLDARIHQDEETLLYFSAKMKYNVIAMRLEHIAYLSSLGA